MNDLQNMDYNFATLEFQTQIFLGCFQHILSLCARSAKVRGGANQNESLGEKAV